MLNPFKEVSWNPNHRDRRKFARSLIIGFPIVALLLLAAGRISAHTWKPFPIYLGIGGAAAGVVFWIIPQIARPFYVAWYFIACCIGFVVGNVLLSAFFYLVLTPIGFLMRAFGRKPVEEGFSKEAATYWREAEKTVDLQRYYRQF